MHVFVVSMKVFARICSNQRTASFLQCSPPELLIKGLSLTWDSPGRLCGMASKPQKSSYLCFPSTDWADMCVLPCLTLTNKKPWVQGLNSNSSYLQGKYFTNCAIPPTPEVSFEQTQKHCAVAQNQKPWPLSSPGERTWKTTVGWLLVQPSATVCLSPRSFGSVHTLLAGSPLQSGSLNFSPVRASCPHPHPPKPGGLWQADTFLTLLQ